MNNMISAIAFRNLKSRKSVFCLVGAAIILTSILFTTIISIGVSIAQSMEIARQVATGSNSHAGFTFSGFTSGSEGYSYDDKLDFLEKVRAHPLVRDAYLIGEVGRFSLKPDAFNNPNSIYACADEGITSHLFAEITDGRYPQNTSEILFDTHFKSSAKVGDTLEVYAMDSSEPILYTICGLYTSITDARAKNIGITGASEESFADEEGAIIYLKFANTVNIEGKMEQVSADIDPAVGTMINGAFLLAEKNMYASVNIIVSVISISLIVFLCGFLLIYNIYCISLQRDAKTYAMMKTLGTTKRQMMKIVFTQANVIYLIFAPVGITAGYLIGWISLSPLFMSLSGVKYHYEFDTGILIFTLIFTYLTTLISALAPVGKIAKLSCITAIKDTDSAPVKIKVKKSTGGAVPWKMALSNMRRERKKNAIAIASVSLSIITFTFMHMIVTVMYNLNEFSPCDFTISPPFSPMTVTSVDSETGELIPVQGEEIPAELAEQLAAIEGVRAVYPVRAITMSFVPEGNLLEMVKEDVAALLRENGETIEQDENFLEDVLFGMFGYKPHIVENRIPLSCFGLPDELFEMNTVKYENGEFDSKLFKSGKYAVTSMYYSQTSEEPRAYYNSGDIISIEPLKNDYEVMCVAQSYWTAIKDFTGSHYTTSAYTLNVYLPMSAFIEEFGGRGRIEALNVMIDEGAYEFVRDEINSLCAKFDIRDKRVDMAEYRDRVNAMVVVGYTLAVIVFLIGIMNYINCIMCGVYARRHEFALLETVGMTNTQLKKMQLFEGLYFIVITSAIGLGAGIPLLKAILRPLLPGIKVSLNAGIPLSMIAALSAVAVLTIVSAIQVLKRQSMIERLKISE